MSKMQADCISQRCCSPAIVVILDVTPAAHSKCGQVGYVRVTHPSGHSPAGLVYIKPRSAKDST